jgi:hypothetical protein
VEVSKPIPLLAASVGAGITPSPTVTTFETTLQPSLISSERHSSDWEVPITHLYPALGEGLIDLPPQYETIPQLEMLPNPNQAQASSSRSKRPMPALRPLSPLPSTQTGCRTPTRSTAAPGYRIPADLLDEGGICEQTIQAKRQEVEIANPMSDSDEESQRESYSEGESSNDYNLAKLEVEDLNKSFSEMGVSPIKKMTK